ncbi:MAG: TolC family protein [Pseudomonadota bacterium]|nr:TolC family protein [Pseudomonadota bacterium]
MKRLNKAGLKPGGQHVNVGIMVVICMLFSFGLDKPSAIAQESAPEPLVALALKANPELKSIDLQVQALRHKAKAVQKWMDPVFAVEYSNFPYDTWSMGDSPMTGVQFKLQQTFTLSGKNERREATVRAEAQAIGWSLAEKRNQLVGLVKRTYWGLALVRQLRSVNLQHIELVRQFVEVIRIKYQVGKAGQHDLMRLEVLQSKLEDDLGEFDCRERELSAALNAVLHRSPGTNIATPERTDSTPSSLALNEWIALAINRRPALKGWKAKAEAKRVAAAAAAYERYPDITVWAGYRIRRHAGMDDGTDQMSLGLAVPLPFNYSGSFTAQKAMRLAEAAAMNEQEIVLLDEIKADLESALAAWERAHQKAATYSEELIPKTRKTLDSTMAAYQSNRADFASLYQVELQLLDFERVRLIALSQTWIQRSIVETLAGNHIPEQE